MKWIFLIIFFLGPKLFGDQKNLNEQKKTLISSNKQSRGSQKGRVVNESADIYQLNDFDSPVIAQVKKGQIYDISLFPKGPFYKIRLKPGFLGWIPDTEIKPLKSVEDEAKKTEEVRNIKRRKLPFVLQRYRGFSVEGLNWTEDTMGKVRSENRRFYGGHWSGINTMFSGALFTEAVLMISPGAPQYYKDATGQNADGWILKGNFLFETTVPETPTYYLYYGFGPSFSYSHFDVALNESGRVTRFSMDDFMLGAVFNIGVAFRAGAFSPRFGVKYYWEKKSYWSGFIYLGYLF